jgi:hypothetical protein
MGIEAIEGTKNRKDDGHEMMTKSSSRVATARDGRTSGVKDSMSFEGTRSC